MKISFYGYNAFIIEAGDKKIAIDPGALFLYFFRMTTVIPKEQWPGITHIFVTHGDPDHYWHADRVAKASGAPVIMNHTMIRDINGKSLALGPRSKGLAFTAEFDRYVTLGVDEKVDIDGVSVTGLKATHGPLTLKIGPFRVMTVTPGPEERVGWGAIGFHMQFDGISIVNLGDTFLHAEEWSQIGSPDLLMIPIGGREIRNTMDEADALEAVKVIKPRLVIPCHYNCLGLFSRKYNPADDAWFKNSVIEAGYRCEILQVGQSLSLN